MDRLRALERTELGLRLVGGMLEAEQDVERRDHNLTLLEIILRAIRDDLA